MVVHYRKFKGYAPESLGMKKASKFCNFDAFKAEREGFEPPVRCRTIVFKTTAFDHSAISPLLERETRLKLATLSLEG
jgi:hypothetical protein